MDTPTALRARCEGYAPPRNRYCGKCAPCVAAVEIERLRALADRLARALAFVTDNGYDSDDACAALAAYDEARK